MMQVLVGVVIALATLIAWLWNRMTGRIDRKESEINELKTAFATATAKWDAHLSADETIHNGIRDDMAQYAMDSTRQHGELKSSVETLRTETNDGRRILHSDLNGLRETVAEMRGQLATANQYNEAILKALTRDKES